MTSTPEFYYYHCAEHIPSNTIHCRKDDKEYLSFPQEKAIEYTKNVYFTQPKDIMDKRVGILNFFLGSEPAEWNFLRSEFKNKNIVLENNNNKSIAYLGSKS
jgi:hypothetical protein